MKPLTDETRKDVFVVDDSLFDRSRSKEYRGISYDAMNAHAAIVFSHYMMMSVAQRENEDDKTICELCFCLLDEFTASFIRRLPQYMQDGLERKEIAA